MSSELLKHDVDPVETQEWLAALNSLLREEGPERAQYILDQLSSAASKAGLTAASAGGSVLTDYINTIATSDQPAYPGKLDLEQRIRAIIRWNAVMIVLRASKKGLDLGGHMSSFASSATIYDVCFNHFFRARNEKDGGDLVYFQGHISPGVYARAFVEGRLTADQLDNFRQEVDGKGNPFLSASETDAGILAVPDRIYGFRPNRCDLSGAFPEISDQPRYQRLL